MQILEVPNFTGLRIFFNSTFSGLTYFSNSTFNSTAIFSNSIFSTSNVKINLSGTHMPETPDELNDFTNTTSWGLPVLFRGSTFMSDFNFENVTIVGIGERLTKYQISSMNYYGLKSRLTNIDTPLNQPITFPDQNTLSPTISEIHKSYLK